MASLALLRRETGTSSSEHRLRANGIGIGPLRLDPLPGPRGSPLLSENQSLFKIGPVRNHPAGVLGAGLFGHFSRFGFSNVLHFARSQPTPLRGHRVLAQGRSKTGSFLRPQGRGVTPAHPPTRLPGSEGVPWWQRKPPFPPHS